jgi:hypothetical protein
MRTARARRWIDDTDRCDDAITATSHARDVARLARFVIEGGSQQLDTLTHRFRADDETRPDEGHELVDGDDVGGRAHECEQQIEGEAG